MTAHAQPARPDRSKQARGAWGERVAADDYRRDGYRILARNWRCAAGELDLVVERDGVIVFSEVKARRTARFGPPAAAVHTEKQARIRRLSVEWLRVHRPGWRRLRYDVVAITGTTIHRIESAF